MLASCAARNPRAAAKVPPPAATAFERQIANAVDAGEGDFTGRALRRRMAADPGNLDIRVELIRHFASQGHHELAAEHARLASELFPASAELVLLQARSLRALNLRPQAAALLNRFLAAHPQKDPDYDSWLGILYDELKQPAPAEQAHRRALALDPSRDTLHNNLGYSLLLQGKNEEAASEFRAALKINPKSETARNNLGVALAAQPYEAILHWQSVADPATAHSNMAAVLIDHGRYDEARREIDIALGYNRRHAAALANLQLVSRLDGKPAALPMKPLQSRWGRIWVSLRRAAGG
jgi:Flp pilus assembly protein TadD